jgi:hypothetical protein
VHVGNTYTYPHGITYSYGVTYTYCHAKPERHAGQCSVT